MIYIAWATLLAGLLFSRKSEMTLAVTAMMGGIILLVAHLSWMDPEITNLVPVLKSYWLTIHVATIVASYGFLGLGALLAFVNLISFIMKRKSNVLNLDLSVRELTYVIEMTLIFGLILLTIGNFLGGVWANESWGRYWGWDPKETWSLITWFVYATLLHARLTRGWHGRRIAYLSMVGFAAVIFTYFGVNLLPGLHSYGAF
jgi:cytochrome c-type biogenesis protein CcsB